MGALGAAAIVWLFVMGRDARQSLMDVRRSEAPYEGSAEIRREIWFAHDLAVLEARANMRLFVLSLISGVTIGIGIGITLWKSRHRDATILLWDRVAVLESEIAELRRGAGREAQ